MNGHGSGTHAAEGELMQLALGETDDLLPSVRQHVAACAQCAAGAAQLGAQMQLVSTALQSVQLPAQFRYPRVAASARAASRNTTPYLRAAAILLVASVPVVASETVRSGMLDLVGLRPDAPTAAPTPAAVTAAPEDVTTTFWFTAPSSEYSVVLSSYQVRGQLVISRSDDETGMLSIDNVAAPAPQLSERGLRISNSPSTFASYTLHVPSRVSTALVRIGAGPLQRINVRALSAPLVIELSSTGR